MMRGLLFLCVGSLFPPVALAHRVLVEKGTGKLIEYQSHAREGTLLGNAQASGIDLNTVEEKDVTLEEWASIREQWIDKPARDQAEKDKPVEIPLSDFGALAGGIAGAASLVIVARRKKAIAP